MNFWESTQLIKSRNPAESKKSSQTAETLFVFVFDFVSKEDSLETRERRENLFDLINVTKYLSQLNRVTLLNLF